MSNKIFPSAFWGLTLSQEKGSITLNAVGIKKVNITENSVMFINVVCNTKHTKKIINTIKSARKRVSLFNPSATMLSAFLDGQNMRVKHMQEIYPGLTSILLVDQTFQDSLFFLRINDKEEGEEEGKKVVNESLYEIVEQLVKEKFPLPIPESFVPKISKQIVEQKKFKMIKTKTTHAHTGLSRSYIKEDWDGYEKDMYFFRSDSVFPYELFYININSQEISEFIKNSFIEDFSRGQFMELHNGRAPRAKSLLKMINPKRFNMKKWSRVLEYIGGIESFLELSEDIQESIVFLYELFQEDSISLLKHYKEGEYHDLMFLPLKDSCVNAAKEETFKELDTKYRQLFIKALKGLKYPMLKLSIFSMLSDKKSAKKLFELLEKEDIELLERELSKTQYDNVKMGGELMALICSQVYMHKNMFKQYQDTYIGKMSKMKDKAITYPTVKGVVNKHYSWECINMTNPQAWVVGLETNCCQHLNGIGRSCVLFAADNVDISGIFRVMKNGKTVAQSFFWYHQHSGTFVFDNIEALGGTIRDNVMKAYFAFIDELEKRKELFGYKRVTVGVGFSKVDLKDYPSVPEEETITLSALNRGHSYTDANRQKLLKEFA